MAKSLIPIYSGIIHDTVWITTGQWNAVQKMLQNTDHTLSTKVQDGVVTFTYKTPIGSGEMSFVCQNKNKRKR